MSMTLPCANQIFHQNHVCGYFYNVLFTHLLTPYFDSRLGNLMSDCIFLWFDATIHLHVYSHLAVYLNLLGVHLSILYLQIALLLIFFLFLCNGFGFLSQHHAFFCNLTPISNCMTQAISMFRQPWILCLHIDHLARGACSSPFLDTTSRSLS